MEKEPQLNNDAETPEEDIDQAAEKLEQEMSDDGQENELPPEQVPQETEVGENEMSALERLAHRIRTTVEIKGREWLQKLREGGGKGNELLRTAVLAGALAPSFLVAGCGQQGQEEGPQQEENVAESVQEGGYESEGAVEEGVQSFLEKHGLTLEGALEGTDHTVLEDGTILIRVNEGAEDASVEAFTLNAGQQDQFEKNLAEKFSVLLEQTSSGQRSTRSLQRNVLQTQRMLGQSLLGYGTSHAEAPDMPESSGDQSSTTESQQDSDSSGSTGTEYPIDFGGGSGQENSESDDSTSRSQESESEEDRGASEGPRFPIGRGF